MNRFVTGMAKGTCREKAIGTVPFLPTFIIDQHHRLVNGIKINKVNLVSENLLTKMNIQYIIIKDAQIKVWRF